jgi:hypothetical protein
MVVCAQRGGPDKQSERVEISEPELWCGPVLGRDKENHVIVVRTVVETRDPGWIGRTRIGKGCQRAEGYQETESERSQNPAVPHPSGRDVSYQNGRPLVVRVVANLWVMSGSTHPRRSCRAEREASPDRRRFAATRRDTLTGIPGWSLMAPITPGEMRRSVHRNGVRFGNGPAGSPPS